MENNFKLLTMKEESKLCKEELVLYYNQLRVDVLHRKLQVTTPGALTIAPKLKRIVNKVAKKLVPILAGGDVEIVSDGQENIPEGAVLFASTHQGILDNFCWISETPKHCVILHSKVTSPFLLISQLCTGLVLVSKKKEDIDNRRNAKLDMIQILLKGHSIWYSPESAWNLSPNKLHLPLSFGFLDVAKKAGVPVIPVVTEFSYDTSDSKERVTKVHTRYGKPIVVNMFDDLNKKLLEYEEQISTIRWELFEEKGQFERNELTNWDYINYLKGNISNLEFGKIDINIERKGLKDSDDDFYLFHHINDVPFNEKGELLETEEKIRLKKLFWKNYYKFYIGKL